MIEDEVVRGVRAARVAYAELHGFNIRAMVADLQAQDSAGDWPVVSHASRRPQPTQPPNQALQPTGNTTPASRNPS
jgi:hypothetical protein